MSVDYTNVEESKQLGLGAGIYKFIIRTCDAGKTKVTGREKRTMDLQVQSKEGMGLWVKFHTLVFLEPTEKGAGLTKKFLKVVGLYADGPQEYLASEFIGRGFMAEVKLSQKGYAEIIPWQVWGITDKDCPKAEVFASKKEIVDAPF